jgi:hypothetical protein
LAGPCRGLGACKLPAADAEVRAASSSAVKPLCAVQMANFIGGPITSWHSYSCT